MSNDITVVLSDPSTTVATVDATGNQTTVSSVGIQGPSSADSPLSNNVEVDVTTNGKIDGSVLVYKTATSKWTATKTLDAQNMEGGHY
jgi:hypothetical protein